ncbi:MAG TPA: acylphosphatase [Casimicrobiaceae bacterium]|nr:acylphosphatase [Casimicrobiaceae bacterium]
MTVKALHLLVHGRVQGVGYRDAAVQAAFECGVQGWVRNRRDGRVEAHAQGEVSAVDRFADWCRRGPPLARVIDVTTAEAETDPRLSAFETRATG